MKFKRLTTRQEVRDLIEWHNAHSATLVLDTETSDKNPRKAKLLDIQIEGRDPGSAVIFSAEFAAELLKVAKTTTLVAHNYKYDAHVLYRHTIDLLNHTWRDTLLLGHLVDENRESYSLDSYVKELWNDNYKEEFWSKYRRYEEASEEDKLYYACSDIIRTRALFTKLSGALRQEEIPDSLVQHVHNLQKSLVRTEIEGVKVDLDYLTQLGVSIGSQLETLKPRMRQLVEPYIELVELAEWGSRLDKYKTDRGRLNCVKKDFSFDSSKQLIELLYGQLGLEPQKNEKTKNISVDEASLDKLRGQHPIIELIQDYRGLQKVQGTYIQGTLERVDNERIYPEFRVSGTVTGRISHANPNLGQLPRTGGVRGIYTPDPGYVFISADYSQLEVCIEANLTDDKNLAKILNEGLSKHDITAQELGIDRSLAKNLNFGMQYHCTHFKVAKMLGVSVDEGMRVWKRFWEIYSGPKQLKDLTDREIDTVGYVSNMVGRKRRFGIQRRNPWSSDYRMGYNFKVQGPGAEFTNEASYLIHDYLIKNDIGKLMWSIHDEVLIQAKLDAADDAEKTLISTMEGIGNRWGLKYPLKAKGSGPMERWED